MSIERYQSEYYGVNTARSRLNPGNFPSVVDDLHWKIAWVATAGHLSIPQKRFSGRLQISRTALSEFSGESGFENSHVRQIFITSYRVPSLPMHERSPEADVFSPFLGTESRCNQIVGMVPPSMTNSVPVIAEALSDAIKATSSATSSACRAGTTEYRQ